MIDYLMKNTGIDAALNVVFSDVSIAKIMEGRNYHRSLKAHTILSTALKMVLIKQLDEDTVAEVSNVYRSLINDSLASLKIDSLRAYPVANGLMEQVRDLESGLSKSPLFTQWLQYINIIDILHSKIYAERAGCWESYVKSVRLMLPYVMAATNRDKYTKLLRWLLDEFEKIPEEVKSQFLHGGFVVRTSTDNIYGCQYGDYTIETFLMEPFKGVEGLTRGRSLDPLTRMIWINNRPQLGEIDRRIRLMAGLILDNTTSRHLKKTLIDRENRWVDKTVELFEARCVLNRDSVSQFPKIVNIGSGYVAPNTVNIHEAHHLGDNMLSSMDGVVVEGKFKWNRKDCVTQMPSKPRIMVMPDWKKEARIFDTAVALQRVMINAESIPRSISARIK